MSNCRIISVSAIAALGIACVSAAVLASRVADRSGEGYNVGAAGVLGVAAVDPSGWYDGHYYLPGFGLAPSAVVGGVIVASSPWYSYPGYGSFTYLYIYGSSEAGYYGSENSTSGFVDDRTTSYYDDY